MATNLRLTNVGVAAILKPANVGTQAVRITRLALGAGSGPGGAGNDARTTLRDQRDIENVVGSPAVAGKIAVLAEYTTATAYPVTELGLFAQIDANPAFLLAYWTDDGTPFINKVSDLRTLVAATLSVVRSKADIAVTVSPAITVGAAVSFDDLSDTPASKVNAARRKVAVKADGAGLEYATTLAAHEVATDVQSRAGVLRTVAVPPAGLKAVISDLVNGAPNARNTLKKLSDAINARITQGAVDERVRRALAARPVAPKRLDDLGEGDRLVTSAAAGTAFALSSPATDFQFLELVLSYGGAPGRTFFSSIIRRGSLNAVRAQWPALDIPRGSMTIWLPDANTLRLQGGLNQNYVYGIWGRN